MVNFLFLLPGLFPFPSSSASVFGRTLFLIPPVATPPCVSPLFVRHGFFCRPFPLSPRVSDASFGDAPSMAPFCHPLFLCLPVISLLASSPYSCNRNSFLLFRQALSPEERPSRGTFNLCLTDAGSISAPRQMSSLGLFLA